MYLITGGTGFIGKHLTSYLYSLNYSVRLVSRNDNNSANEVVVDLVKDDIPHDLFSSVKTVFHLAGCAHDLNDSEHIESKYKALNVDATIKLAKQAASEGVENFVYLSSVKAGGVSLNKKCMTELDQFEPDGIYGKTKREAEKELIQISRNSNMRVSIIRSVLVYGPGVKGNLKMMLKGIERGWFPPLPETGNKRSMIHVEDLVKALLFVSRKQRSKYETYIATDGRCYSSRQIYEAMCHALNKPVPAWCVPKYVFDIAELINDKIKFKLEKLFKNECYSSKKLENIGFKAKRSLFDSEYSNFL